MYPGVPNNTAVTHARRLVTNAIILVWDDKMCQAAEILMVHENCVSFFGVVCRAWYTIYGQQKSNAT